MPCFATAMLPLRRPCPLARPGPAHAAAVNHPDCRREAAARFHSFIHLQPQAMAALTGRWALGAGELDSGPDDMPRHANLVPAHIGPRYSTSMDRPLLHQVHLYPVVRGIDSTGECPPSIDSLLLATRASSTRHNLGVPRAYILYRTPQCNHSCASCPWANAYFGPVQRENEQPGASHSVSSCDASSLSATTSRDQTVLCRVSAQAMLS